MDAWWFTARPEQLAPPGDWFVWLIQAGRGFGKTRTGAEWLLDQVVAEPAYRDNPTEWAAMGEHHGDTRDIILNGPSGLLRALAKRGMIEDKHFQVNRSAYQIVMAEGQVIHLMGGHDPDVGRGYNLAGAWLDEFAKWRYGHTIWNEGLAPALRAGKFPRVCITTTPKVTCKMLMEWNDRTDGSVHLTRGSLFDNKRNLSKVAINELKERYEGTTIGRQELYGELVTDVEGAIWTTESINDNRDITFRPDRDLHKIVIGVDPPGETAECGIVTGCAPVRPDITSHAYILDDTTVVGNAEKWGQAVVDTWKLWGADEVVVEKNQGGDMVRAVIQQIDPLCPVKKINAFGGKDERAQPVATQYEKGRIHHVGTFGMLESQMTTWTPKPPDGKGKHPSPDRIDALVHCIVALVPQTDHRATVTDMSRIRVATGMR